MTQKSWVCESASESTVPVELWNFDMMDEQEVYWAACLFLREHGEDAVQRAAERTDALLARGDIDGARAFKQILDALDVLIADRYAYEGTD
jgi:hypothetical protein